MLKKIIIGVCVIVSLITSSSKAIAEPLEIVNPVNLTLDQQINYFSELYHSDVSLVRAVIRCESGFDNSVVSDGNRSKGIAQIQEPTWNWMEKEYFDEFGKHLDYTSATDQINILVYQIEKGNGRNWTAYRAIMNGGTYSFYSRQLQKHFTVHCSI